MTILYPISDGEVCGVYGRGTDVQAILAAIEQEQPDFLEDAKSVVARSKHYQTYIRVVPCSPHSDMGQAGFTFQYIEAQKPARGAFLATCICWLF